MEDLIEKFDVIFLDRAAQDSRLVNRLVHLFPSSKITWVEERPFKEKKGLMTASEFTRSKRQLYVGPHKGEFFKRCPGQGKGLSCCNYFVFNFGSQCDMDCSYCYLQGFLNTPVSQLYSNLDEGLNQLKELATLHPHRAVRVGTGEIVDSLSLDPLTLFSHDLIDVFKQFPNWSLEFKTKSDRVDQFLHKEHVGNILVSWSLNPQNIITTEELGTASLKQRLAAARKCLSKGFQIAFHIDPIIYHQNWQNSYKELVTAITSQFEPGEVPYVSLGSLRFQPEQAALMRSRAQRNSQMHVAEMFPSKDGKMRYDFHLRTEMFSFIQKEFISNSPNWKTFLCMETPESWATQQRTPFKEEALHSLFDPNVVRALTSARQPPVNYKNTQAKT